MNFGTADILTLAWKTRAGSEKEARQKVQHNEALSHIHTQALLGRPSDQENWFSLHFLRQIEGPRQQPILPIAAMYMLCIYRYLYTYSFSWLWLCLGPKRQPRLPGSGPVTDRGGKQQLLAYYITKHMYMYNMYKKLKPAALGSYAGSFAQGLVLARWMLPAAENQGVRNP